MSCSPKPMVGMVIGPGQTHSRGMNRARVKYLTLVSTIVAITMIVVGCTSTQSPTITTVVVEDPQVPEPSEQFAEWSFPGIIVHGETGTTEWWCEDRYCYYRVEDLARDDTCRRVERDAVFDGLVDETLRDHTRVTSSINKLIAQGKSEACSGTGPN